MPLNPVNGKQYQISDNGRNRLHIYGTAGKKGVRRASADYRVVKMSRPQGYSYDPKTTQYFKTVEDKGGLTATRVYQNGRRVRVPGSAWAKSGLPSSDYQQAVNTWNVTNQPTLDTLGRNRARERSAQNNAFRQIAGYYSGLEDSTRGLMRDAANTTAETDAALKQVGVDRDGQIRAAIPQYEGPLAEVAQRIADSEGQGALNRGAAADAANRAFGLQTGGTRRALLGQVGAGQAMAGQERLSLLKGQGNQALQSYTDKINEIEGQKPAKILDTARQLQYDREALGVKQAQVSAAQTKADAALYKATHPTPRGSGGGSGGDRRGGRPLPKGASPYGASAAAQRSFWNKVDQALMFYKHPMEGKRVSPTDKGAFNAVADKVGSVVAAEVARSIYATGGLTPYAASRMHQAGYASNGRYGTRRAPARTMGQAGAKLGSDLTSLANWLKTVPLK